MLVCAGLLMASATSQTVLVVGGGIGGIAAANRLRHRLDRHHRVVLINREPDFTFAASYLWVMTGARRPDQITRSLRRLESRGIEVVVGDVTDIDPVTRTVTAGGWLGAVWMPVKLLVVPFLLFVQIIGWTVYVHHVAPDIRWWTRREWTQFKGQMESTTILRMPRVVNRLWFHNICVHVPHHVDARIRFDHLPKAAAAIDAAYPNTVRSSKFSIRQYFRTTRACKLYDFEAGRWLPYRARYFDLKN